MAETCEPAPSDEAHGPAVRLRRRVRRPGVALLIIDNPPVNALGGPVRAGLLSAIAALDADPSVRAVVIAGRGPRFVAGADIREFEKPIEGPQTPDVIAAIEASPKIFVAAIHGVALGAGLELALGCDARLARAGASLGLPEVTLGIPPGAGGTTRLPLLVGAPAAAAIGAGGGMVDAARAAAIGLVDAVTNDDLIEASLERAAHAPSKRRARDANPPTTDAAALAAARAAALETQGDRPATRAALAAVERALTAPFDAALAAERSAFLALRGSVEAAARRHLFFASRRSGRRDGPAAPPMKRIALIGAGPLADRAAAALAPKADEVRRMDRASVAAEGADALRGVDAVLDACAAASPNRQAHWRALCAAAPEAAVVLRLTQSGFAAPDLAEAPAQLLRLSAPIGPLAPVETNAATLVEMAAPPSAAASVLSRGLAVARLLAPAVVAAPPGREFVGAAASAAIAAASARLLTAGAAPWQLDLEALPAEIVPTDAPPERAPAIALLGAALRVAAGAVLSGDARSAEDVDVALTAGYGFPRHLGGPSFLARRWSARGDGAELAAALAAADATIPTDAPIDPGAVGRALAG